jgi:DEAD/DEAH box helicase domain-containing protein
VRVLERFAGPVGERVLRSHGEVRVSRLATVYKKVRFLTHENVGSGPINLPEQDLHTTAVWGAFRPIALGAMPAAEQEAGLVGASRALHAAACLLCMCDPRDLGTHVELRTQAGPVGPYPAPLALGPPAPGEPQEFAAGWRPAAPPVSPDPEGIGWPAVYLYDATPGGVGFAQACFDRFAEMVASAIDLVAGCSCATGCPSCVGPAPLGCDGRAAALRLLRLAAEPA